jgi:hypothetical protein
MNSSPQDKRTRRVEGADATRHLEADHPLTTQLESSDPIFTLPGSSSDEQPPDVGKILKTWIWQQIVKRFGLRWTIVLTVFLFICFLTWGYGEDLETLFSFTQTLISELRPLPKANPNVFTVALVHLENDEKGQMESNIVDALGDVKGIAVLDFNRPPISDDDRKKVTQKYLTESGAQVLIWGKVITISGKSVPKLYWTVAEHVHPAKESGRYFLREDLSLPPVFMSDLANVLGLLVVTQSLGFSSREGHFIADQLAPFIEKVKQLLGGAQGQGWRAENIAQVSFILGNALLTFGSKAGKKNRCSKPWQHTALRYRNTRKSASC